MTSSRPPKPGEEEKVELNTVTGSVIDSAPWQVFHTQMTAMGSTLKKYEAPIYVASRGRARRWTDEQLEDAALLLSAIGIDYEIPKKPEHLRQRPRWVVKSP